MTAARDEVIHWAVEGTWYMKEWHSDQRHYRCYKWVRIPHPGDRDGDSVGWQFIGTTDQSGEALP